jgi:hypothetical protein
VPVVRFVAVGATREEEFMVNLVRIGLEFLLENSVCLVVLLSFKSMGDFAAVNGGDEAVSNRTDCLVEVGLCGKDVDRGLQRYGGVVGCELHDCGGVGDGVEWNREDGRGRRSGGRRLIGQIDGRHVVVKEGVVGVNVEGEIGVGMELQGWETDGGWIVASLIQAFMLLRLWCLLYCFKRSGAFSWSSDSHVLSASGYPFHLRRYWSLLFFPK